MTTNEMIDKYAFIKALNTFLRASERVIEDFISYDNDTNILTREQFCALLKLSSAIENAKNELI